MARGAGCSLTTPPLQQNMSDKTTQADEHLLGILRDAGYQAEPFQPGETLAEFTQRVMHKGKQPGKTFPWQPYTKPCQD